MRLFIAEKPSIAQAIAAEIGIKKSSKGYKICTNGDIVTHCFGHMLELAEPDTYTPDNIPLTKSGKKKWRLEDLPIAPEKFKKITKNSCKEQIKIIKELISKLRSNDCIVNAGDPDREGQLLVDEIIEYCKYKGKVLRYWQSAMDPVSVQRALSKLENNEKYYNWGIAAQARSQADWLIGMNLTRCLTVLNSNDIYSVGRVQTPLLKIICDRDNAIKNFKPKRFYNLKISFKTINGDLYQGTWEIPESLKNEDGYLLDESIAKEHLLRILNKPGKISSFEQKLKKENPPLPFDLATLQEQCSNKFGFSASKTLEIAQQLYEKHKMTSYPRSSCGYLPSSQKDDVKVIFSILHDILPNLQQAISTANPLRESKVWNDKAVGEEAHTGIIPTLKSVTSSEYAELSNDCKKVYELIATRYVACFLPDFSYQETVIFSEVENELFKTTGKKIIDKGFKSLLVNEKENKEPTFIPIVSKGDPINVDSGEVTDGETKPPKPFTEGTLIKTMQNVSKYIDDKEAKKILSDTDGIGTAATRAEVIKTLFDRGYIETLKNKIKATEKGHFLISVAPKILTSPILTAQTETKLNKIQKNEASLSLFMQDQTEFLNACLKEAQLGFKKYEKLCPDCHHTIKRFKSKFNDSWYWKCFNCNSSFKDNAGDIGDKIEKVAQVPCPHCKNGIFKYPDKFNPGTFRWYCKSCDKSFKDENGKPGTETIKEKKQYNTCPACKEQSLCYLADKTDPNKHYHFCFKCKASFTDKEGKPDTKIEKKNKER